MITCTLLALAACTSEEDIRRLVPPEEDGRGRAYMDLLRNGQLDSATNYLAPSLRTAESRKALADVSALISGQKTDSIKLVSANIVRWPGGRSADLSYQLYAPRSWLLANIVVADSSGEWVVVAATAKSLQRPLEESVKFSLRGRSPLHYVWLLLTAGCALLSVCTAAVVATRRSLRYRWLLAGVSLFGVGAFTINWATGEVGFAVISVQLFSAAVTRAGPFAPWMLTFSVPLGAIFALVMYCAQQRQSTLHSLSSDELLAGNLPDPS